MRVSSEFLATLVLVLVSSVAYGDPLVPALILFGDSVVDAEYLGFTSYPPAYLSQDATGNALLTGANFASAASGLYDRTANLYRAITLTRQLNYYKEYQTKVANMVGKAKANNITSGAIHLLSAGSSDYIQNYYINPLLNRMYTPDQFSDILMRSYSTFIQVNHLAFTYRGYYAIFSNI
ncbi:hypothetical protein V6N13_103635 [Hibiscus sabdariffa]